MIYTKVFECEKEEDTKRLAQKFANIAKKGDVFALYGTLGAGKSCFSRYFIQELTDAFDVPSPTFTLVQIYEAKDFEVYHFDMYRLKDAGEAYELGIEESFYEGVNLVEWPEKIKELLPNDIWKINISVKEGIREFSIEVSSIEKKNRLDEILI